MALFAVIQNNLVINNIDAPDLATAEEATGLTCLEYTHENPIHIGESLTSADIKKIEKAKAKREAEAAAAAEKAEADRVAAIEAELARVRALEAERLAAEEAAKPKPVTGVFVKVSQN